MIQWYNYLTQRNSELFIRFEDSINPDPFKIELFDYGYPVKNLNVSIILSFKELFNSSFLANWFGIK